MAKPRVLVEDFADMLHFDETEEKRDTAPATVQGGIATMKFDLMETFPNHRFKLYHGKQFDDMVDSIRQFGILLPLILWHTEDNRYIILSGHNRRACAVTAGLNEGPVIIRENLTYEDAVLIVIETNLRQRSFTDMSESERAYCLYEHYKAVKSQGKRNDLIAEIERLMNPHETEKNATSAEISRSSKNRAELAEEYNLTEDKLAKYIRIGEYMDTALMELFDEKQFPISVANTLSFITDKGHQQTIARLMVDDNYKMDGKIADLLRSHYESGKLTDTVIIQILSGEKTRKPKSNKPQPFKVKPAVISKYFSAEQTKKEIEETIDKALALYFENQNMEVVED